jgi:hypothetical protein
MLEPLLAITTACLPSMPALWTWVDTEGRASLRRLLSRVGSSTSLMSRNSSKQGVQDQSDDDHSMKSLNSHGLTQTSDVKLGHSTIKVKRDYTITSTERGKANF